MSHVVEYEEHLNGLLGLVRKLEPLVSLNLKHSAGIKIRALQSAARTMREQGFYVPHHELFEREDYTPNSRSEFFSDIQSAEIALSTAKLRECDLARDVVLCSIMKAKRDLKRAFPEFDFTFGESIRLGCKVYASAAELREMVMDKLFDNAVLHGEPGDVFCDYDDQAAWVSPGMHVVTVTNRTTRRVFPAKIDAIFNRENPALEVMMYGHNLIDVRNTVERYNGILLVDSGASPGGLAFRVSIALPSYRG